MPRNPAITTYEAWDNIFRFMQRVISTAYFREVEHAWELDSPDPRPAPSRYGYWSHRPLQMLTTTHGIRPIAVHAPTGRFIYELMHKRDGGSLLKLSPDGAFQLGRDFDGNMTWRWGPFDAVSMCAKFIDHHYNVSGGKVWFLRDTDESPYLWRGVRHWERPVMYWREGIARRAWLFPKHVNGYWQASVVPGQVDENAYIMRLDREYGLAEERYERYRRKYLREHNLPDAKRPLDTTDIEFIDHISQHINLYEPGKARLLRDAASAC